MLEVDNLSIGISASSDDAEKSLNNLINTLTKLTNKLQITSNQNKSNSITTSGSNSEFRKLNKTLNTTNRRMKSLASVYGSFYANFFPLIRGVKALGKAMGDTTDYLETFNFYSVSLKELGISGERVGESLRKLSGIEIKVFEDGTGQLVNTGMKNLGLNINEVTNYAARLLSVTNSLGLSSQISETAADAFTKLAGDISSLYNIDYSAAATNLQSGLIGQSRALYKYGIDITNATLQTYAYEMGLSKAVSEMTQAEKMQLRMIAILNQSKVAWGDLANTINSPANAIRQFKNNLSELSLVIGQLFIPLLSKVMPFVNGLTMALKSLMTTIAGFFGIRLNLTEAGQSLSGIEEDAVGLEEEITAVGDAAEKTKKQLAGYDELNVISQDSGAGSGVGAIGGGIDLSAQIEEATKEYLDEWEKAYKEMENKAQAFAEKITNFLQPIANMFEHIKFGELELAGEDFGEFVLSILDGITAKINETDWSSIGTNIGKFIKGIPWIGILSSVGSLIWAAINAAIDLWKGSFDAAPIETGIITAIGLLTFTRLGDLLSNKLKEAVGGFLIFEDDGGEIIKGFSALSKNISTLFGGASLGSILAVTAAIALFAGGLIYVLSTNEEVKESFNNAIAAIKEGLQPALEFLTTTVLPDISNGFDRLKEVLSPLAEFIGGFFVSVWQDILNPAITFIGKNVLPSAISAFESLWNNVLVPLGSFVADILAVVFKDLSSVLEFLWRNIVVPLAKAVGNVLGKAFEGLFKILSDTVYPMVGNVINIFKDLWNNAFIPIANWLTSTFRPIFETVFNAIGNLIDGLSQTLGGLIDFITGVFTGDWELAWEGVKDIFKGILNTVASIFEGVVNFIIDGINLLLRGLNGIVTKVGDVIGIDIEIPEINHIDIPELKDGGFPSVGNLFIANEAGPELVGTMDNKPVVANNEQIVDGIRKAAYEGMKQALMETYVGGDTNVVIEGDVAKFFKAVKKENRSYHKQTGKFAY